MIDKYESFRVPKEVCSRDYFTAESLLVVFPSCNVVFYDPEYRMCNKAERVSLSHPDGSVTLMCDSCYQNNLSEIAISAINHRISTNDQNDFVDMDNGAYRESKIEPDYCI